MKVYYLLLLTQHVAFGFKGVSDPPRNPPVVVVEWGSSESEFPYHCKLFYCCDLPQDRGTHCPRRMGLGKCKGLCNPEQ